MILTTQLDHSKLECGGYI